MTEFSYRGGIMELHGPGDGDSRAIHAGVSSLCRERSATVSALSTNLTGSGGSNVTRTQGSGLQQ